MRNPKAFNGFLRHFVACFLLVGQFQGFAFGACPGLSYLKDQFEDVSKRAREQVARASRLYIELDILMHSKKPGELDWILYDPNFIKLRERQRILTKLKEAEEKLNKMSQLKTTDGICDLSALLHEVSQMIDELSSAIEAIQKLLGNHNCYPHGGCGLPEGTPPTAPSLAPITE